LVARNAARHLEESLSDREGGWQPLVYCWRGGQRSGSFASILSQVGWRTSLLEGGYRTYRRMVVEALYEAPFLPPVYLLDGNTGTAKTRILEKVGGLGVQVLDLEGLANHRGSLFGGFKEGQPSQKSFEGALAQAITPLEPSRPVLIEAESSKIGERMVPPSLWAAMKEAPRLRISAPLEARSEYLTRAYSDLIADKSVLRETIGKLASLHSVKQIGIWLDMAETGEFEALAGSLMEEHYDPRYRKGGNPAEATFEVDGLGESDLDQVAARIGDYLGR